MDYDIRRPLTPTATNLLGLIKHLAAVELGYFGLVFDRPFDDHVACFRPDLPDDAPDPNVDMWRPDESREQIVDVYRRARAHSDATIQAAAARRGRERAVVASRAPPPDTPPPRRPCRHGARARRRRGWPAQRCF